VSNNNNTYSQLSRVLSNDIKLIPRVEEFMTSSGIVRQNFHEYIGKTLINTLSKSKPKKALNIMMYGHPSMGKTTELRQLTTLLCKNKKFQNLFHPFYSELQRARANSSENESMWTNIRSGSIIQMPDDYSLENLADEAEESGKTPLIILDTLDILLIDEVIGKSDTIKKWKSFLEQTTRLGIALFWTCRPYEWNTFQNEMHPTLLKRTLQIELPQLQKERCKPFPISSTSKSEKWQEWTRHLQSQMPLFAGRWSGNYDSNHELPPLFFQQLEQHVHEIWDSTLHNFNLKSLQYPSAIYYAALWETIHTSFYDETKLERSKSNILQQQFETFIIQNTHITRTHRLRFNIENLLQTLTKSITTSTDMFVSQFVQEQTLNQSKTAAFAQRYTNQLTKAIQQFLANEQISQENDFSKELSEFSSKFSPFKSEQETLSLHTRLFFDLCIQYGLLSSIASTETFEFTHQLLFEETLATQEELSIESFFFPSLALRFLSPGGGNDLLRREAEKTQIHWTGAILSFHPEIGTVENVDWNLWIEEAYKLGLISNDEENEMNEKSIIMKEYFDSPSSSALFLRGAPGTGKTYFCLNFIMEHLKRTSKKMQWRYVTLNRPLVDSVKVQWDERSSQPQNAGLVGMEKDGSGPRTVKEIILEVLKESDDARNHNKKLLDFLEFKRGLKNFFARKNINPPSFTDAWADFTTLFHHPSGAISEVMTDFYDYEESPKRRVAGSQKQITLFADFCFHILKESQYITYAHASFLARKQIARNRGESKQKYDMLMIDEVQDISPSTMALLLLLLRPKFNSKSILVAGDDLQTVNRSGFQWFEFCQNTIEILSFTDDRAHQELNRLLDFGISQNVDADLVTLKQVYRNAPKIARLNDEFRNTFAHQYPSEKMPNYPREFLKVSDMALEKNSDCRISIIYAPEDEHILQLRQALSNNSNEISKTSRTAIITPYESTFGDDLESIGNFTTYNGETVKGLEFSGVIVFNPYEMIFSDAEGNLSKGLNKSDIENRIRKWMERDSPSSKSSITNFLQLYQNIMTRMNVLLSRPEYRLLLVSRHPFPKETQENNALKINRYFDISESIIFSLPKLSNEVISELDIEIFDMSTSTKGLDKFLLSTLQRQENSEGYNINDYLRWALDESQIGNFNNERLLWQRYLDAKSEDLLKPQSLKIPYFSTLLLAGQSAAKSSTHVGQKATKNVPTILTGFRKQYSEDPEIYGRISEESSTTEVRLSDQSENGICELFLTSLVKGMEGKTLSQEMYFSLSKLLQPFMRYVLSDARLCREHYPYILELLLSEFFGLTFSQGMVKDDEDIVFDENLSLDTESLIQFSPPKIDWIITRGVGGRITLDASQHVLDRLLLHIYDRIDHAAVDYILDSGFNLDPKTRADIDTILHTPSQSEFWVELAAKYKTWNSLLDAPTQVPALVLTALKREELSLTLDLMLKPFSTKEHSVETSFDDIITSISQKNDVQSFFDSILSEPLILTYDEMSPREFEAPNAKLFNSSEFWNRVKNRVFAGIDEQSPKFSSHFSDKTPLRSTWYYNWVPQKEDGKPNILEKQTHFKTFSQSNCMKFIQSISETLNQASNWGKHGSLAIDIMSFTDSIPNAAVKFSELLKEVQLQFEGELRNNLRPKQWYEAFLSELFRNSKSTNQRELNSYRMDSNSSEILETNLITLFQIVNEYYSNTSNVNSEKPQYQRELYVDCLYRNILLFAPKIFSDLGGGKSAEQAKYLERKQAFAKQFASLIETLPTTKEELEKAMREDSDVLLLNRIPTMIFDFDVSPREPRKRQYRNSKNKSTNSPNPGQNFGEWLAIVLFASLENCLKEQNCQIQIQGKKLHSPASEEVITKLKIYFELFFEKSDPNAFFSMFYSMLNCGNYRTGDSLEAIGVLTPVRSYFNISRRTAFFISSMTQLIDSIDNKPPGFLQARNTPPISYHPVYLSRSESGIDYRKDFAVNAQEWERIRNTNLSTSELAAELRLSENVISKVRKYKSSINVNLIPFEMEYSRTGKNQYSSIHHPRMAAFDIAVPIYSPSENQEFQTDKSTHSHRDWIIKNIDGLSQAYKGKEKQRRRLIRHICHGVANSFIDKNYPVAYTDNQVSIGRALAISHLRTPEFKDHPHLENHQLDWRMMYEMMRIGFHSKDTFDTFVEKTSKEITKIASSNPISFMHFLSPPQVDESWLIDDLLDLAAELNVEMPTTPLKDDFIEALRRGTGDEVDESQTISQLVQKLESLNIQVPQAPTKSTYLGILIPALETLSSTRKPLFELNEFYNALKNPIQYLFADLEIFQQQDFTNSKSGNTILPANITPEMLFFYSTDAMNYKEREVKNSESGKRALRRSDLAPLGEAQRESYNRQILSGFVHYLMFKAGYRVEGEIDNSVEIEDLVFTKYKGDEEE